MGIICKMLAACALGSLSLTAAALEVTGVTARQRWPWNNLVDIGFTLSGVESSETLYRIDVKASYDGMAGEAIAAKSLVSEPLVKGNGAHTIVWDMGRDLPGLVTSNLAVTVLASPLAPAENVYMVLDLTQGPEATAFPVRYSLTGPDLSGDVCRTSEMWLKLCPAGTFTMGTDSSQTVNAQRLPAHSVSLTKPFYLGIFEVTQEQYYRINGEWPSYYTNETCRATRPVENVKYDENIRPAGQWYDGTIRGYESRFMARLRALTGRAYDLPTEAQWEYACRAGTTGLYYDPRFSEATIQKYCRAINGSVTIGAGIAADRNDDATKGTAKVGSYDPNPWGFYDMYGNVAEICGDGNPYSSGCDNSCLNAFAEYIAAGGEFVDPRSPIPGTTPSPASGYAARGGSHTESWPSSHMTSASRLFRYDSGAGRGYGFRVCLTAE